MSSKAASERNQVAPVTGTDHRFTLSASDHDRLYLMSLRLLPRAFGARVQIGNRVAVEVVPSLVVPQAPRPEVGQLAMLEDEEGVAAGELKIKSVTGSPSQWFVAGTVTVDHMPPRGQFCERHPRIAKQGIRTSQDETPTVLTERPLNEREIQQLASAAKGRPAILAALLGTGRRPVPSPRQLLRALDDQAAKLPRGSMVTVVPLPRYPDQRTDLEARKVVARALGGVLWEQRESRWSTMPGASGGGLLPTGVTVMFTGFSGSGKSTIARGVKDAIVERADRPVSLLDGDVLRRHLSKGLGFSREDRDANVLRIGFVAAEIARHGGIAVCAPIAPYASTRAAARQLVEEAGGRFVLVHVATPLDVCEGRDRKGLYAQARAGQIAGFTGVSDPYEAPVDADLTLDTTHLEEVDAVDAVIGLLVNRGLLRLMDGEMG